MTLYSWALLLGLSMCWGTSFLMIAYALESFSPIAVAFWRLLVGTVLLWGIVWVRGLVLPKRARLLFGMLLSGLFVTALPFALIAWGQQRIDSGLAAIFNSTAALFSVLLAALLFHDERLTRARGLGVLLGFVGVIVTVGIESLGRLDLGSLAQYAVLAAACCYAVGGSVSKVFMKGVSPLVYAAAMTSFGTLLLLPFVLWQGLPMVASAKAWSSIVWLGVISTTLAYLLYFNLLRVAGVANALLCTLILVPIAILLGAVVLQESLSLRVFGGFSLIGLGLLIIDGRILRLLGGRRGSGGSGGGT